jgi:hypothetical protein
MATEKQIRANRQNARKSTGPRSQAGKAQVAHNAYQHGLSTRVYSGPQHAKAIERLTRQLVGDDASQILLVHARAAIEGQLELARVRRTKIALIRRAWSAGSSKPPREVSSFKYYCYLMAMSRGREPPSPFPRDPSGTMPPAEPDRTAEAIRRALPELAKLERYERRAVSRRDQALQFLASARR